MLTHTCTPPPMPTWVALAPYGDHPHSAGLQCLTPISAQRLCTHFNSWLRRLRSGSTPIYLGHPDDPDYKEPTSHPDTYTYGWAQALQARKDGLWVKIKCKHAAHVLLQHTSYRFLSPRWTLKPISPGRYEPIALISIGLTQHPNLPVQAIVAPTSLPVVPKPLRLPTCSQTQHLKMSNASCVFHHHVQQRMRIHGQDFTAAWAYTKGAYPQAYAAMLTHS